MLRVVVLKICHTRVKDVIGRGGTNIRLIESKSNAKVSVKSDGSGHVMISAPSPEALKKAQAIVEAIEAGPIVGEVRVYCD